ncbi:MAG: posphoenolpyruvate synthetase regulatory kinase/phosphorylase PpsR [Immundisolibacter sp.]|uniref:posphoenolpyruvate synthetase regulatory kinase/phosphorylase PpsR n=1 Tax=Immundisolibacter sp. TaxID=1934948 RepID=UPI003EDF63D8
MTRSVFFVSDQTGITVQTLGHALLTHFPTAQIERVDIPFVDSPAKATAVLARILDAATDGDPPVILCSISDDAVRAIIKSSGLLCLDVLEAFIAPLEAAFGVAAAQQTLHTHGAPESGDYEERIEAINFSLAHDDGVDGKHLSDADIILIGVSRSGKTPTSLYLSLQFGIRAANFPLTEDDLENQSLPKSLLPHHKKLFGLSIDPMRIRRIREERRPGSRYASLPQCQFEARQALRLYQRLNIPHLDSTHKSIEEISTTVIQQFGLKRRIF